MYIIKHNIKLKYSVQAATHICIRKHCIYRTILFFLQFLLCHLLFCISYNFPVVYVLYICVFFFIFSFNYARFPHTVRSATLFFSYFICDLIFFFAHRIACHLIIYEFEAFKRFNYAKFFHYF